MFRAWRKIARGLVILSLLCVLTGCGYSKIHSRTTIQELPVPVEIKPGTDAVVKKTPPEVKPPSPTSELSFYIHRVRWPGETLSIIAQWYTGSWKNWKSLSKANSNLNPKRIVIGSDIFIPEALMKSRKPMPISFLSSSVRKKSVQSFPSNKPSIEEDVAELFGAIETDQPLIESGKVELFGPIENNRVSKDSDTIELFKPIE